MNGEPIQMILLLFFFGAMGAFVKEILADNKLTMPKIMNGEICLGFLGSVIIGGFVGYFVDHSPITAFFAGYAGFSALGSLIPKQFGPGESTATKNEQKAIETEKNLFLSIRKPFDGTFPITQKFGDNPEWYKTSGYAGHFGLDFGTPFGTPILACDAGEIIRSAFTTGNGYFVEIKHSWGSTLYLHFKESAKKKVGDFVQAGELIGYSGNTGAVIPAPTKEKPLAGSHLHFSLKINGVLNPDYKNYLDPLPYLKNLL